VSPLGRETCRRALRLKQFGLETCRRAHVESLTAERLRSKAHVESLGANGLQVERLKAEWRFRVIHEENFMSRMEMSFFVMPSGPDPKDRNTIEIMRYFRKFAPGQTS